jgi:predicted component of type VI protein secretion system
MSEDLDIHDKRPPQSDAAKLARQVEANDIKWLMSSRQGRRVMWLREGMRNVGLMDIADITKHAPEGYALMFAEANGKENA